MPGLLGNPPAIRTPGRGPNGPGVIDMRLPETSVGAHSSVPYGPTLGYATPNGVTGFIGPAAGSIQQPTTWYVRTGGSNLNGGTSTSLAADRSGTDGGVTNGGFTFTAVSGAFTTADIGKGICVQGSGGTTFSKITGINSSTSIQMSNPGNGTSGSRSWAIGGAWANPIPAMGGGGRGDCGVLAGDTVYIGAGTYRAILGFGGNFGGLWSGTGIQTVPIGGAGGVAGYFNGQVNFVGDVTGQYTGDAGMVQLTAYTTNDKTAPTASILLNFGGRSNIVFSNILFVSGSAALVMISAVTAMSQNITFRDCGFISGTLGGQPIVSTTVGYGVNSNWLLDRCFLRVAGASLVSVTLTTGAGSDYDCNWTIQNSILLGTASPAIFITNSGVLANKGGGVRVRNVTCLSRSMISTTAAQNSTIFPCTVYSCYVEGQTTTITAGTTGQILEDYNIIVSVTPRGNVTAGAHSISDGSYAPLYHIGQERIWLPPIPRFFGEPMASSPLLGFGSDGAQTPYDLRGLLNLRPAGGASALPAVGALERSDTFVADASPIGSGGSPIKLTGPGYNDILLPIAASQINQARTVSVLVEWDANYATGTQGNGEVATLPALLLIAKPQMGITSGSSIIATGTAGNAYTITLPAFSPTAVGVLTLRLVSYDLSGLSVVEWDDLQVL